MSTKEHPILFSAPMVRAILDGKKTQTRRVAKMRVCGGRMIEVPADDDAAWVQSVAHNLYGKPGDRLWVRETFALVPASAYRYSAGVQQTLNPGDPDMCAIYREGWERSNPGGWRPSIFMPRWASRITLEITGIRVERLQQISEADGIAEGATMRPSCNGFRHTYPGWSMDWSRVGKLSRFATGAQSGRKTPLTESDVSLSTARIAFANFYNRINGPDSWDANPWVWVVEFQRIQP